MDKKEFSKIRGFLGKTQKEMAGLLGISKKSVESFEQGWRKIPAYVERQALFLLSSKAKSDDTRQVCWEIHSCPDQVKDKCPAWEFELGHLCWFINGTKCRGIDQDSWHQKMGVCRNCEVLRSMLEKLPK